MSDDIIADYMRYTKETESPYIYHRWVVITMISALLGKKCWLPFGHARVFPSIYVMLIGDPGTRKSTAIKTIGKKLITAAGYEHFSGDKGKQEKFLLDLSGQAQEDAPLPGQGWQKRKKLDEQTLENLWGDMPDAQTFNEPREVFICADEFSVFSGTGEAEFYTLLGNFWDWDDEVRPFTHRLKSSASVAIYQPTVAILGGTTASKFAKIFPPEIMEDGFMSRMIIIKGFRSERIYPDPVEPVEEDRQKLVGALKRLREGGNIRGAISKTEEAKKLLGDIYRHWQEIPDVRFSSYSTRRHTQLMKLCLIVAAARGEPEVTASVVVTANTYLAAAEAGMPAALGEFGKARNSDVSNKVMDLLYKASKPVSIGEIWKHCVKDLENLQALTNIMDGLRAAGRIQLIRGTGIGGWLAKREITQDQLHVDWSLLTDEERKELGL